MKKIIIITIVVFFISKLCIAQTATISGYVRDYSTGDNIIGTVVYDKITKKGTTTNNYGFYSLTLKTGSKARITASYVGYHNRSRQFLLTKDTIINFSMRSSGELENVIVTAERSVHQTPEISVLTIPMKDIKLIPSMSGEADVLKVFQLMPGVQSGQEGSSALYVRGGSPDQNLFLIDDVPLYYVNHLGGFVSVFDDNAINSMNLIKGGFPARYGGRLSSVIDMRMKNGNLKEMKGEIKTGLVATKIFIEGPLLKNKTSFMFSARRSNIDLFSRLISKINDDGFTGAYTFYDIYGKIHHKFSDKNSIFISTYSGRDKITLNHKEDSNRNGPFAIEEPIQYSYESQFHTKWGNQMAAFRWNHLFGNKLFSNLSVSYLKFYYNTENEYLKKESTSDMLLEQIYNTYNSGVNDLTAKLDFDYYPSSSHKIKFGVNSIKHLFKPGISKFNESSDTVETDTTFGNLNINTYEINAYIEDEISLGRVVSCNIGLFASYYNTNDTYYQSYQPRVAFNFKISNNFSIKSAYSKIEQNLHLLTNSSTGIPTDIWLPTSKELKPQRSDQYVINTTYTSSNKKIEISIEGFYKEMSNLIDFKEGASYQLDNSDWHNIIETGGFGRNYGLEFLLQRKTGKTTGWIAYTLSKSEKRFENINSGNYFPSTFDRRHDIAIVINHKLTENISLSANWVYTSGSMMTLALSNYNTMTLYPPLNYPDTPTLNDVNGINIVNAHYYGGRNNFRLPAYHRLDLSVTFEKEKTKGIRTWQVGLYNAYFQKNIFFLYYKNNGKDLYKFTLFPIIPSISYSFRF